MKEKPNLLMPLLLMAVFALTRWPGMMPQNFSAAYALVFCGAVYLPGGLGRWLPLAALAVTDLALDCYYTFHYGFNAFQPYQLFNYAAYAAMIWLGRRFKPGSSWLSLFAGGMFGALMFYFLTNTAAWFFNPFNNPEYTKTLAGWIIALTQGTAGWPETWEFLRNTLLSGGLFTGLFAGAMKLTEAERPEEEETQEAATEEENAPAADESAA